MMYNHLGCVVSLCLTQCKTNIGFPLPKQTSFWHPSTFQGTGQICQLFFAFSQGLLKVDRNSLAVLFHERRSSVFLGPNMNFDEN